MMPIDDHAGHRHHAVGDDQRQQQPVAVLGHPAEQPQEDQERPDADREAGDAEGRVLLVEALGERPRHQEGEITTDGTSP